jgi:hypothetical protein
MRPQTPHTHSHSYSLTESPNAQLLHRAEQASLWEAESRNRVKRTVVF